MNMMNKFLDKQIKLEEMTALEFTQLMTEWKQQLKKMGAKDANGIVESTLKLHLQDLTNENEQNNIINYLRSV